VVDGDGVIVAGNGTFAAAKAMGWKTIDVVRTKLRGAEARAYAISDNRTAELAEWDAAELTKQLEELSTRRDLGGGPGVLRRGGREAPGRGDARGRWVRRRRRRVDRRPV